MSVDELRVANGKWSAANKRPAPPPAQAQRTRQAQHTRLALPWDLLVSGLLTVALIGLISLGLEASLAPLRLLIAVPVLFFCPGYVTSIPLFARRDQLTWVE